MGNTYSYDDVVSASTDYFGGDDLAGKIFADKYALRNDDNELVELTPEDMHRRMAKEFARVESGKFKNPLSEEQIYSLFKDFKRIVPQGSPMYGIGNPYQYVSIANCFVLPSPLDSYAGITYVDALITQVSSRRGGVGWDISNLRPKDMPVKNAAKSTTGMIPFMVRYSNTIREVGQFGRRGASLQACHVKHPEIEEFITIKQDLTKVTGSNISVKFTDDFFATLKNDGDFTLQWPVDSTSPKVTKNIKAKELWKKFIHSAWLMAEPGCMFFDTVMRNSNGRPYGQIETASNPCGEQYLPPAASCRLIAIVLSNYVIDKFTPNAKFDWKSFKEDVKIMQRLGDDMVDLEIESIRRIIAKIESDPEPQYIKQIALDWWNKVIETAQLDRRTGCGLTGLGDAIAGLGIKYGSDESVEFAEEMQKQFKLSAYEASVDMAQELGAFPQYDPELDIQSEFIQRIKVEAPDLYKRMTVFGRRNMVLLTIAPTGTVSCLTQTTSGIEPVFMLKYTRRKKGNPGDKHFRVDFVDGSGDSWMHFDVYHHQFLEWMRITGKTDADIAESPYHEATDNDIDWLNRVRIQAVLQKHIDNSISTTINLPNDATEELVSDIYLKAHELGCKGMTVYRDGCRTGVLVADASDSKEKADKQRVKRPKELPCDVHHIKVKGKEYFVLIGIDAEGKPYEVFAGRNGFLNKKIKHGKIVKMRGSYYKAIFEDDTELSPIVAAADEHEEIVTRLVSVALRNQSNIDDVVDQLEKVNGDMYSFGRAISRTLKKYIAEGTVSEAKCPECKEGKLIYIEGCKRCRDCSYSACK